MSPKQKICPLALLDGKVRRKKGPSRKVQGVVMPFCKSSVIAQDLVNGNALWTVELHSHCPQLEPAHPE
jgi:hypothetical protein